MKQGLYETVLSKGLLRELALVEEQYFVDQERLDDAEAKVMLTKYISLVIKKALGYVREQAKDEHEKLLRQIEVCNKLIDVLVQETEEDELDDFQVDESGQLLTALYYKLNNDRNLKNKKPIRPATSLVQSALFTGATTEPNMVSELKKEIVSSDSIDLLVSFIKWSGMRCIIEELKEFTSREGKKLRIITTSYMGATDEKAIWELAQLPNTQIKISYDTNRTRLHAKAYLFKRETGFSTAYIGSSNLSHVALTSGLEWNLKVTEKDSFDILRKFEATFDSYWNDAEFVLYTDTQQDRQRLRQALKKEYHQEASPAFVMDIRPYAYQKEILASLEAERKIHGHFKNLVIAATGVGKTVVAAFDYKRFTKAHGGKVNRLLFVAHREELLKQSLSTFRAVLGDQNFGELMVGGNEPEGIEHLFISIQSFNSKNLASYTSQDYYDFIIVDEFHHAAAPTYRALLEYYKPKILLGLTATPERGDGQDVFDYFDGRISAEIRLPEAIDRKLLSPFQYFGVTDDVDLSRLKWGRRGYDTAALEKVYTANDHRAKLILESVYRYVTDIHEVVGLGFCVSVEHAKFMANYFSRKGIKSLSLHKDSTKEERQTAKSQLINGSIKFIFVVDLYNEGVDIPEVNTVLFLRPTESLTVFLQQLGRGLRLSEGKECLTVLDFVGQAHKRYNFEEKYRALIGKSKHSVRHYLENGFLTLPKGCYIHLEKQAKAYILRNIKESINTKAVLIQKLKNFEADTGMKLTLKNFLEYHHLTLVEFYGKSGDRSFIRMLVEAQLYPDFTMNHEKEMTKRLKNFFHIRSPKWIQFMLHLLSQQTIGEATEHEEEKRMLAMMYYSFFQDTPQKLGYATMQEALDILFANQEMRREMKELLNYVYSQIQFVEEPINLKCICPLEIHCEYTRDQIMAAFGYYNETSKPVFREGVKYLEKEKLDMFFVTLNKSEKDYSPSTLYEDYAVNEILFHWQSQSTTSSESPTGLRYRQHEEHGSQVILFVRESKNREGLATPFTYLGPCHYRSHTGTKPMSILWELDTPIPPSMLNQANKSIVL